VAEASPQNAGSVALNELQSLAAQQVATLAVTPGSDAHTALLVRHASQGPGDTLLVHYTDSDIFAEEIAAFGKDVRVLEPSELVTRVVAHLKVLVKTHG
jgi:proteasome accessory factor B